MVIPNPLLHHHLSLHWLVVTLALIVPLSHLTRLIVTSHLVAATTTHPKCAATTPSIALLLPPPIAIAPQILPSFPLPADNHGDCNAAHHKRSAIPPMLHHFRQCSATAAAATTGSSLGALPPHESS
jgi:hypothetical protein